MEAKKANTQIEKMAAELAKEASSVEQIVELLRGLMKSTLQHILDSEMDAHLGRVCLPTPLDSSDIPAPLKNRKNGHSKKTVQSEFGELPLDIPRDRAGSFEPQVIPKHQRRLSGFDDKVLALHAKGLTTRDIQDIVGELYGVEVSASLISQITAESDGEVSIWRSRRLEAIWPIVFFDGIVVHVRGESARVSQHTVYVALGVNLEGRKELLGLWLNETEGAKFWLGCLTDLRNRGLSDIFVACMDGLTGFPDALRAAYPETVVQLCIVHLVRAALKYTIDKDSKEVAKDLKAIYQAATALEAEEARKKFAEKWDSKYPTIAKQWRLRWAEIVAMFDFPPQIRRAIYTTNTIESLNSTIRKFTRNRKQYPSAASAVKMIYTAINEASKKWTMPITGWKAALNHFAILFEGRMNPKLSK